jgi:hypothetical protein
MTLFRSFELICGDFHTRQQFRFCFSLAKRIFVAALGIVFMMARRVATTLNAAHLFIIHITPFFAFSSLNTANASFPHAYQVGTSQCTC